jgi:cellulose biosynthesis protein BcsQ
MTWEEAPNLGIMTLNGLRIADGYIIPTSPDVLSAYAIRPIVERVQQFGKAIGRDIVPPAPLFRLTDFGGAQGSRSAANAPWGP